MVSPRRLALLACAAAMTFPLIGGASAQGATQTVTLGSPLGPNLTPRSIQAVVTLSQDRLPGAILQAPFDGTITSWRVIGATGTFNLRVVRKVFFGFIGAGTASSGPIPNTGIQTFNANLPIQAGDSIGIDTTGTTLGIGPPQQGPTYVLWDPPLVDNGQERRPDYILGDGELGFNATVVSTCIVPNVKGKKKKAAKKALRNANCGVGKVKGAGRVKKQKPAAGRSVPTGTPVNLKLR
jgi:PASTA domain-containing protein